MIRLSAAVLASILLFATEASAGDATQGAIRLAQADDQPMVITPQPRGEQLPPPQSDPGGPGVPYESAPGASAPPPGDQAAVPPPTNSRGTFSAEEIKDAGHRFFGSVSMGLARAIEYTFQRAGRPNGYILGEEAGGAIIAGVRYGEGRLYTKDAGEFPFIGKVPRSATTSAPRAQKPWSLSTISAPQGKFTALLQALTARPISWAAWGSHSWPTATLFLPQSGLASD